MPFTVIWSAEAETELARLHLKTRRRPASELWRACAEIERHLRHNPAQAGGSLDAFPGLLTMASRLANHDRLAVVYEVRPDDMQVIVSKVLLLPPAQ